MEIWTMITACIIDNNKVFAEFLKGQLNACGSYEVLYCGAFSRDVVEETGHLLTDLDVLILGVSNGSDYPQTLEKVLDKSSARHKIILHDLDDGYRLMHFLSLGINGLISKIAPRKDIIEHIETTIAHQYFICPRTSGDLIGYLRDKSKSSLLNQLTEKQRQITEGLLRGLSYKEIAVLNGISINTVNDYLKRIYKLLNISSRSELQARFNKSPNSIYL